MLDLLEDIVLARSELTSIGLWTAEYVIRKGEEASTTIVLHESLVNPVPRVSKEPVF